jgi:hypothetical protein
MTKPIVWEWMQFVLAKKPGVIGKIETFVGSVVDAHIGEEFSLPEWTKRLRCKDGTNAELILAFNDFPDLHDIFNGYTNNGADEKWVQTFYAICNAAAKIGWKMVIQQHTAGYAVLDAQEEQDPQIDTNKLRDEIFYDKFLKKIEENKLLLVYNGLVNRFGILVVNQAMKDIAVSMFTKNFSAEIPDIDKIMKN